MLDIYRKAFSSFRQFWWFFLVIAVTLETASALLDSKARLGSELFLQFSFLYFLHRTMLLNEGPDAAFGKTRNGKASGRAAFLWVTFLYFAGLIGATLAAYFSLIPLPINTNIGLLIFVIVLVSANWVGLSVFGSAFPASAINDRFGFGVTLQRARATGLRVALQLLCGPGLWGVICFAVFTLGPALFGVMAGLYPTDLHQPFSMVLVARSLLGVAARLGGMTASTLAVAVLCDAYRHPRSALIGADLVA